MRKLFLVPVLLGFATITNGQTLTVNNYSSCDVQISISATGPSCSPGYGYGVLQLAPKTSGSVTGSNLTPVPSGSYYFNHFDVDSWQTNPMPLCQPVAYSTPYGANIPLGNGSCHPFDVTSGFIEQNSPCNSCPTGTVVSVSYTDLGSGSGQVDFR